MKKTAAIIFLSTIIACANAQDISGTWKGSLTLGPGGCFPVYNIELNITLKGSDITGTSYHYSDITNYVKEEFDGLFKAAEHRVIVNELKVMTFHVPVDCVPCIKNFSLYHTKEGNKESLVGEMAGKMMNGSGNCPPGRIKLTRITEDKFKDIEKASEKLTLRKNELVKEIKVDTGVIHISFYDNGIIDNDSISVFVNNFPVLSMKKLTSKALPLDVKIDLNRTQQEVIMIAENLGTIPPNTALMTIMANGKRYQLFLTATEQKNAMVRFVYEKPPPSN
jgi:hypothetical protein